MNITAYLEEIIDAYFDYCETFYSPKKIYTF